MTGPGSTTVSVLMPVHAGARAPHVDAALSSVFAQSRPADEVVVVLDGPVGAELEAVLARFPTATVVRTEEQRGAGAALARGMAVCRGTYVARADSDDVNEPRRLEVQVALLEATAADVCSGPMVEFEGNPDRVVGVRSSPVDHDDFARRMRARNPVNHPTVLVRRAAVVAAGGYQELAYLEDYDLWARMLADGARFVGTREPLVRFRVDGMHERRTDRRLDRSERELQRRLVAYGLIGRPRAVLNLAVRGLYRRLPRPVVERVYARLFRSGS